MKNLKLAVFDLDSTLAPVGHSIPPDAICKLQQLRASGVQIAISSGKPAAYLAGIMRQIELTDVILMGEMGLDIQCGAVWPPKWHYALPIDPEAAQTLHALRAELAAGFPGIWMQNNQVVVTPFFRSPEERDRLKAFLDRRISSGMGLEVYEYQDCFDISPRGIDKGGSLLALLKLLGLRPEQTAAIGDGANDIPMFAAAGLSILVGGKPGIQADIQADTIQDALDALLMV